MSGTSKTGFGQVKIMKEFVWINRFFFSIFNLQKTKLKLYYLYVLQLVVDENVRGVVSLTEDFEMKGMIPTEKVHVTSCRYISLQLYEKKIVM